jgi:hypothetical protein
MSEVELLALLPNLSANKGVGYDDVIRELDRKRWW